MQIFFFTTKHDDCASRCRWRLCPERYLHSLRHRDDLGEITALGPLTGGIAPRSDDLVILYADGEDGLDRLVGGRDRFEGIRKILVVGEAGQADDHKYHLLEPRYITQAERSLAELAAVIKRMKMAGAYAQPQPEGVGQ